MEAFCSVVFFKVASVLSIRKTMLSEKINTKCVHVHVSVCARVCVRV